MTQQKLGEGDFPSALESLNTVLPLIGKVVDLGGRENKPSLTVGMWMQVWRRWWRTRRSEGLSASSELSYIFGPFQGGVIYPCHSQSSLTASPLSLVLFSEAALVSRTPAAGHNSESCDLCSGIILQEHIPLVLWFISTSPGTVRVCRNHSSHKKKVFRSIETCYLSVSL